MPTITIPAFGAGENLTLEAPADWHPRIETLAERTVYGPRFSRRVVDSLRDMHATVTGGYTALAYDSLLAAERYAQR